MSLGVTVAHMLTLQHSVVQIWSGSNEGTTFVVVHLEYCVAADLWGPDRASPVELQETFRI